MLLNFSSICIKSFCCVHFEQTTISFGYLLPNRGHMLLNGSAVDLPIALLYLHSHSKNKLQTWNKMIQYFNLMIGDFTSFRRDKYDFKKRQRRATLASIGARNFYAFFHASCIYFALTSCFLLAKIARKHQDEIFYKKCE